MMELLFKRLAWGDPLAQEERDRIVASVSRVQSFGPGETIVPAETRVDFSSVLLNGLSARQEVLKRGNRQITAFHLPGDFCDLHTYVLKTLPDSVVAMSECEIGVIPHAQLDEIVRDSYRITRLLWASTLIDASMFRQWVVSIGRRSADARLAHLFCELFLRFRVIGLTTDLSYPLAATQADLADALGLSLVHTNKTCGKLRMAGLVTFAQRTVTIHDWDKLQNFAEFNPEYLHLEVKSAISSQAV